MHRALQDWRSRRQNRNSLPEGVAASIEVFALDGFGPPQAAAIAAIRREVRRPQTRERRAKRVLLRTRGVCRAMCDSRFEIRDSRFEIRDSRFEIRDSRLCDARKCEKENGLGVSRAVGWLEGAASLRARLCCCDWRSRSRRYRIAAFFF